MFDMNEARARLIQEAEAIADDIIADALIKAQVPYEIGLLALLMVAGNQIASLADGDADALRDGIKRANNAIAVSAWARFEEKEGNNNAH